MGPKQSKSFSETASMVDEKACSDNDCKTKETDELAQSSDWKNLFRQRRKSSTMESLKVSKTSLFTSQGVSVTGGNMKDVIGVHKTTINNIYPKKKDYKINAKLPFRGHWSKLIKRHRKEESWIYPFPWDPTIRLAPEEFFIPPSIAVLNRTGQVDLGYVVELQQLFDPMLEGGDRPEHILIRGDAGYGKSTLCTKIAFDWANSVMTFGAFPPSESLVVLYRLRDLPPDSDLEEVLRSFVHEHHSLQECSLSTTQKACWNYGNKLLLILDGYDEVSAEYQQQIRDFLSYQQERPHSFFKLSSVIVTARPDTDADLLYMFDKQCRLTGLTEERRLKMVNSFIRRNTGCATSILTALNHYEDPFTKRLPPLLILMICYISTQGGIEQKLEASQLSLLCIQLMAKRCNEREGLNLTEEDIKRKLHLLGKFFYKCLSSNTMFIRDSDMRTQLKDIYDFAINLGILRKSLRDTSKKNVIHEPIHKHFMESLAKNYLLEVWNALTSEEILSFVSDFVECSSTEILIIQCKDPQYNIKITAKDIMHRNNRIIYMWDVNQNTGEVVLVFEDLTHLQMDLSIKATASNPLQSDTDFFIRYLTNAFSGVSRLKKCVMFLGYFRQHMYRAKFCRGNEKSQIQFNRDVTETLVSSDANQRVSTFYTDEESINFIPWSKLTERLHLIEVELSEALLQTTTISFVCEYLVGFQLDYFPIGKNAKEYFANLFNSLQKCHDRFYVKCVLKRPVGNRIFRMVHNKQNKVDLVTFQCNYKHQHVHPREIELGPGDLVPKFSWENVQSVILYFSK